MAFLLLLYKLERRRRMVLLPLPTTRLALPTSALLQLITKTEPNSNPLFNERSLTSQIKNDF